MDTSTNTVTVTANAGTDQAAVVAALQASEIVAVDIGGIYADLSLSASENIYAARAAETKQSASSVRKKSRRL